MDLVNQLFNFPFGFYTFSPKKTEGTMERLSGEEN